MTSVGIEALNAMLGPLCLFQNRDRDCEEETVIIRCRVEGCMEILPEGEAEGNLEGRGVQIAEEGIFRFILCI